MSTQDYAAFLASKAPRVQAAGITIDEADIHPILFEFQRALVRWSVGKGRAALWADTGLGKTFCQCEWARLLGVPTLIVAPLSVARQTVAEAAKLGIDVRYARKQADVSSMITITNYEMVEHFDAAFFQAVVLDESSILKGLDGKTRARLTEMFAGTTYRLCCTATPAPNDITELANHAEFLGIMRRTEMLAAFFVHDDEGWRLKGHAEQPFYRWLSTWAMAVRRPSDLGYSDSGYILPPLTIEPVWVGADVQVEGQLFFTSLKGVTDRARVRKATAADRVAAAVQLVAAHPDEPWIVWCGLNQESTALAAAIPGAVEVTGSEAPEAKAEKLQAFQDGAYKGLVTKARVAGYGMNMQHCARMVFVGLGDSWEQYYQCIRRCYRFGQTRPVHVSIVLSEVEDTIYQNVMNQAQGQDWALYHGDSVEVLQGLRDNTIDLTCSSPPFQSLFTYNASDRDVGNCRSVDEFWAHFGFILDQLYRVTRSGRLCCLHVAQVPAMLERDGYIGIKDFRGQTILACEQRGWIFHREVCVDKDPQAQAIRTHSKALLFVQLRKDSTWSGPALADYILVMRKPGANPVPVHPDIDNNTWIQWARPVWYGISESDTLQYQTARDAKDERHIAPLQLGTIERCVRLWTNPGETVLDPFAGIASTPYTAVRHGRRGVGIELKDTYFAAGVKNMHQAEANKERRGLFDTVEAAG